MDGTAAATAVRSENTPVLLEERTEGVLRLVMNRPAQRNALSVALMSALQDALERAAAAPSIAASAMLAANSRARARLSAIRYGVRASRWSFRDRQRRCPESMNAGLWEMDSGLAAAPRPGMTL